MTLVGGELLGFYPQEEGEAGTEVRLWPASSEASTMKRKQSHNAYERDRRKRMNLLYSSLRSLLPQSENHKKLSIPNTVARVLDYVPELQKHVENLTRRKEEIGRRVWRERDGAAGQNSPVVSAVDLGGGEIAIQVCGCSRVGRKGMISAVMEYLQSAGLRVVGASSVSMNAGRSLLGIHCQVKDVGGRVELGKLRKTLSEILR
ncbi:protein IRON-RELATED TRANSCRIPTION FACTOR 2-like [Wolffia australiana]